MFPGLNGDGVALLNQLTEALGLRHVRRLVLEFDVNSPPVVYAVAFMLNERATSPLVKLVSAVAVSDRGEVSAEPLTFTDAARLLAEAVRAGNTDAARALADEIVEQCGGNPSSP